MGSIEERVVGMKFDNAQFEKGVQSTLNSLANLNKGLQLQGATKGLEGIGKAAASQSSSLKSIEGGIQSIADKFKSMSIIGITALTNITNKAVDAGSRLAKSLTIGPITDGYKEYETKLNSIQTILANTGLQGKAGLAKVTGALNQLNAYSDKTIYNFGEMARNIGTFTAAGVSLKTSTAAIKGIANLAAVSGSNAQQASTAMYQLSQALSAGKVSLEDWNSVVQAGMGGKVFQNALMATARTHGVAIDDMIKKEGSFRLTLKNGWLSSKILTETLNKFTGDMSAKQLKAQGYTKEQIAGILKMGKVAQDAATKVKTMSQLIGTLQESVGSGWSQTWETIFGNFNEARTLFTDVNNVLGGFISTSSDARNKVLGDWKALGGRTVLIEAIGNAFKALVSVLKPIRDAFREIFPATTGKQLYEFTVALRNFTQNLKIGGETANELKRTFAGVFAVLGIGWEIVKQVAKTFFGLFATATEGSGGFLKTTASIGDFLVALHKSIAEGEGLGRFFKNLGTILALPIRGLQYLGSLFGKLFDNFDGTAAAKTVSGITKQLSPLALIGQKFGSIWNGFLIILDKVAKAFYGLSEKMSGFFDKTSKATSGLSESFKFKDLLSTINTTLFGGLVLLLKKFLGRDKGGVGGILGSLKDSIEGLTGTLKGMQHALNAAALLEIAVAVGILAVSMNTLSKIDSDGLKRASIAITAMMTQLGVALFAFQKISSFGGMIKMPFIAGSMILLATALVTLAQAVKMLSDLNWDQLSKGLVGVAGALGIMILAMKFMPAASGLFLSSRGMVVLAGAIKILASAVKDLAGLSWQQLAKGLTGVAVLLGSLALFTRFSKAEVGAIAQGAGIILLAAGIKILASAMKDLGQLNWEEIAKGLVSMGGALAIIAGALLLIPPSSVLSAAAVLIVATSLGLIGNALKKMGGMDWENIAKGLVALAGALVLIGAALILIPPTSVASAVAILVVATSLGLVAKALSVMGNMDWENIGKAMVVLAGSLTIIALAMIGMLPALPGAAALLIVAASLAVLTPILVALGSMSWESILKGLVALAGAFVVLGVAAVLMATVVPALIGLGVAITLIGVGILAAGAGVLAFALALTALAAAGAAGTVAIVGIVSGLAGLIPAVMKQIGLGIIVFAKVISTAGPAMTKAITTVILALVTAIDKTAPKVIDTLLKMMDKMLKSMLKYVPSMVDTGLKLLTGVLFGISQNIDKLINVGTLAVIRFINGISKNLPGVIQAGVNLILNFINSLAAAIHKNAPAVHAAGKNLALAIIDGMVTGLTGSSLNSVVTAATNVARSALDAAKNFLGIHSPSREFEKLGIFVNKGFAKGLKGDSKSEVDNAFNDLKSKLKDAMKDSAADIKDLTEKLKKLRDARNIDALAIVRTMALLANARKEHKLSSAAYAELTKRLGDEHKALDILATKYEKVTDRLKKAQDVLDDAKKTRDDYNKSIQDEFSTLPDITGETKLADYLTSLKKEVADTRTFSTALQKLRELGLNDEMYKELLSKGVSALPFVQELLSAGRNGVDAINGLDEQLVTLARNLGEKASSNLYQAAVDSASAIVKGLESQQAAIEKAMDKLANAIIKAIDSKLKIGLAKSAGGAVDSAIDAMNKASDKIKPQGSLPVGVSNPKITPVVDLSNVHKSASAIPKIFTGVGGSFALAADVSASVGKTKSTSASLGTASSSTTFNQYNNSPKALSAVEIYRQTSNQLSVVKKGALV